MEEINPINLRLLESSFSSLFDVVDLTRMRLLLISLLTNETTRAPSFSFLRTGLRRLTGGQLLMGGRGGTILRGVAFSFFVENVIDSVKNCGLGRPSSSTFDDLIAGDDMAAKLLLLSTAARLNSSADAQSCSMLCCEWG